MVRIGCGTTLRGSVVVEIGGHRMRLLRRMARLCCTQNAQVLRFAQDDTLSLYVVSQCLSVSVWILELTGSLGDRTLASVFSSVYTC